MVAATVVVLAASGCFGGPRKERPEATVTNNPLMTPPSTASSALATPTPKSSTDASGTSPSTRRTGPNRPRVEPTTARSTASATATQRPPAGGAVEQTPAQAGRRHRPSRITRFFGSSNGGGCEPILAGTTAIDVTIERLDSSSLCFDGYATRSEPTITLVTPSGARRIDRAVRDDETWVWTVRADLENVPTVELGTYLFEVTGVAAAATLASSVRAFDGSLPRVVTSSGRITIRPAATSRVAVGDDRRRGGRLTVSVASFPAGAVVYITIYGPTLDPSIWEVVRDLPDLVTDSLGEGVARWNIPTTAPGPQYAVWVEPTPAEPEDCKFDACLYFALEE